MEIDKAIKLMKSLDEIYIKQVDNDRYIVGLQERDADFKPVICIIDGKDITYCLDDLYNNGCDSEAIDFDQLYKLQKFIAMIQGEEK